MEVIVASNSEELVCRVVIIHVSFISIRFSLLNLFMSHFISPMEVSLVTVIIFAIVEVTLQGVHLLVIIVVVVILDQYILLVFM